MKQLLILLSFFLLWSAPAEAQLVIAGTDIGSDPNIKFVEVVGAGSSLRGRGGMNVSIDYGQPYNVFKDQFLRDNGGGIKSFDSPLDAVNYLVNNGWELVKSLSTGNGNDFVLRYLMRKKDN